MPRHANMKSRVDRLAWTLTAGGRRFAGTAALLGCAGGFLMYYIPNTILIDKYKNITQLYRNGLPVAVPSKVSALVQEVMQDMGMSTAKRKFIRTYTSYGFDAFRAGSTMVTSGGVVGLPLNLNYSVIEDFDHTGITVNNNPVPWSSEQGEALKKSFILSPEAKKFLIARELNHLETAEPFYLGGISAVTVLAVYGVALTINRRLNLYVRPRGMRAIMYGLISMFGCVSWMFSKDMITNIYEAEADKAAAELGEKYAAGGLEFYEKVLARNVALRSLMGSTGSKLYTAYGNDQVLLRMKHIPFTVRRDFLKQVVDKKTVSNAETIAIAETSSQPIGGMEFEKVP